MNSRCSACQVVVSRLTVEAEASGRSEEALQCRDEVACRHPVQVQKRQDPCDLGALPAPGRDDRTLEAHLLAAFFVDTTVVDPRGLYLDRTGRGGDGPGFGVSVLSDQTAPVVVKS